MELTRCHFSTQEAEAGGSQPVWATCGSLPLEKGWGWGTECLPSMHEVSTWGGDQEFVRGHPDLNSEFEVGLRDRGCLSVR